MDCSNTTQCREKNDLLRWTAKNETRQLAWSGILLWGGSLFAEGTVRYALLALTAAALLGAMAWEVRLRKQAEKQLTSLDHETVHELHYQFRTLKTGERTMEKLTRAVQGGSIVADGLSCYERGRHVPGCTHRRNIAA